MHSILAGWKVTFEIVLLNARYDYLTMEGFVMNVYIVPHGTRNYFPPVIEFIYHSRKPFPRGLGVGCF